MLNIIPLPLRLACQTRKRLAQAWKVRQGRSGKRIEMYLFERLAVVSLFGDLREASFFRNQARHTRSHSYLCNVNPFSQLITM